MNIPVLNKPQRLLLAAVGIAIAFIQLYRFAEDGVEGIGWVAAFLVSALLVLPALGLLTKNTTLSPTSSSGEARLDRAKERSKNLVSRAVEQAHVLHRRLPILLDLPPIQSDELKGINSLMTDSWLQYCIAYSGSLSLMSEFKRNPRFMNSPDYAVVWQFLVNEMVKVDAQNAAKHGLQDKYDMQKSMELAKRDMNEGELAMKKFMDRLAQNIPRPDSPFIAFLLGKIGVPVQLREGMSIGVQKFTRETLQKFSSAT